MKKLIIITFLIGLLLFVWTNLAKIFLGGGERPIDLPTAYCDSLYTNNISIPNTDLAQIKQKAIEKKLTLHELESGTSFWVTDTIGPSEFNYLTLYFTEKDSTVTVSASKRGCENEGPHGSISNTTHLRTIRLIKESLNKLGVNADTLDQQQIQLKKSVQWPN